MGNNVGNRNLERKRQGPGGRGQLNVKKLYRCLDNKDQVLFTLIKYITNYYFSQWISLGDNAEPHSEFVGSNLHCEPAGSVTQSFEAAHGQGGVRI